MGTNQIDKENPSALEAEMQSLWKEKNITMAVVDRLRMAAEFALNPEELQDAIARVEINGNFTSGNFADKELRFMLESLGSSIAEVKERADGEMGAIQLVKDISGVVASVESSVGSEKALTSEEVAGLLPPNKAVEKVRSRMSHGESFGEIAFKSKQNMEALRLLLHNREVLKASLHKLDRINARLRTVSESLERRAVEKSVATADWSFVCENPPPILEGNTRIFRGIKPSTIEGEFADPLVGNKLASFQDMSDAIASGELAVDQLSQEQLSEMRRLAIQKTSEAIKFFSDDIETAKKYAQGGAVYFLDVPTTQLGKYYQENGVSEIAFAVPKALARECEPFAVGSRVQANQKLKQ